MTEALHPNRATSAPVAFTRAVLDWLPWLEPPGGRRADAQRSAGAWWTPAVRNRRISACWRATRMRWGAGTA